MYLQVFSAYLCGLPDSSNTCREPQKAQGRKNFAAQTQAYGFAYLPLRFLRTTTTFEPSGKPQR
jgi:hypothetical protein